MKVKYYNPNTGPRNYPLRDGSTLYIPPKAWSELISAEQDGSASLRRGERKDGLKRRLVPDPVPASE